MELENQVLILELLELIASSPWIHESIMSDDSFRENVVKIAGTLGWGTLKSPLQAIFQGITSSSTISYTNFLQEILHSEASEAQKEACHGLASAVVEVVKDYKENWDGSYTFFQPLADENFMINLLKCLVKLENDKLSLSFVQTLCSKPEVFPVLTILAPVCQKLHESISEEKSGSFVKLFSHCISSLEAATSCRTASVCRSQPISLSCDCRGCRDLQKFLEHPTKTEHVFSSLVSHIKSQLDSKALPGTITTESVYGFLTVRKTRKAYQEACEIHEKRLSALSALQALAGGKKLLVRNVMIADQIM